jgi:hypothetical protein
MPSQPIPIIPKVDILYFIFLLKIVSIASIPSFDRIGEEVGGQPPEDFPH